MYDVAVEMMAPRWYQETSYLVTRRPVRLVVTAADADPSRTLLALPTAATAGAAASVTITVVDSFGNVVGEDLTEAIGVALSGPASLASPDVRPSDYRRM